MKKRLTNNWGLKLFSIIFAILLWLVVVNVDNPVKTNTFDNIPVKLQNTNLVTDEGLVYEVLDSTDTVTVSVSAPRSYLELLSKDDIVAVADFNNITAANTVNITYYSKRYNDKITNFKGSVESVKLNIEAEKSLKLVLKTKMVGEVEEGYVVGDVTTDQNQVRISGPESVISQIKSAVVTVDISGTTSDIATYADVKFYDANDNEIVSTSIKKNVSSVKIGVEILATKTVPIKYTPEGTLAQGYRLTGEITSVPSEIMIAGTADALKNVSYIEISGESLDVTGKTGDFVTSVNIKNYLPEGISLADSSYSGKASVTVHIEKEQEKKLNLGANNVVIANVPEGYTATVDKDSEILLSMVGLQADISELMADDITAEVDLTAYMEENELTHLEPGTYTIEAKIDLGENITLLEPIKVKVIIEEAEE